MGRVCGARIGWRLRRPFRRARGLRHGVVGSTGTSGTPNLREIARARLATYEPAAMPLASWRPAAVLLLLYSVGGAEHMLFTLRTDTVEHHKGQISFPGGAVHEADADLETTALRETYEEVGVDPPAVEIIGRLDDMITSSDYRVTPFVGILHGGPYEFVPSPFEVAKILEVPLLHLLNPANFVEDRRERDGHFVVTPAYNFGEHRIWGATARMLSGFLELIGSGSSPSSRRREVSS